MSGLFGGGKTQYVAPAVSTVEQAATDAKKGATDIEKMKQKKELKNSYGKAIGASVAGLDNMLSGGDTTLASGSLLSLGSKLG
mgnify:CR=1